MRPRLAYTIPTWSGARLVETVASLPIGSRLIVVDTSVLTWCLSKAWNYAIERLLYKEDYDAVMVLNDDVVLQENTGELLMKGLLQDQFGPDFASDKEWLLITGYNTNHHPDRGPMWGEGAADYSCFCVGRRYWETIGPFDEGFSPAWFEDNDSHRRIRLAGYEAGCYAPYRHHASQTYQTDPERRAVADATFPKLRERYVRKWGGEPGKETFDTPWNGAKELAGVS